MEVIKESTFKGYPKVISYDNAQVILEQMEKYICKITIGDEVATGFFCKIPILNKEDMLTVFMTNNHVIKKEILENNYKNIFLDTKEGKYIENLDLDNRLKYTNEKYDITIIEIKESDGIENFLELDDIITDDIIKNNNKNREYRKETIYIIQYPDGELSVSFGIIDCIDEKDIYNFKYKNSTEKGSSGSPILNLKTKKIIGIHKEVPNKNIKFNRGTFLNEPIKEFIRLNLNDIKDIIKKNIYKEKLYNYIKDNIHKEIITYDKFSHYVNSVIILSDKRLCSCSSDCSIKIFDISNSNFDLQIDMLNAHNDKIWCIEEIKKNILASGGNKDIKIWNINNNDLSLILSIHSAHNDYLNKIIKLNNDEFASCARDGKIKIWSQSYKEKKCINAHTTYVNSILKLKNNMLVSGSNGNQALKFWNLDNYTLIKSFKNFYSTAYNNTLLEVDNVLFVGEKEGIRIYSLEGNILSFFYQNSELNTVLSLCYIGNNIIIAGTTTGYIYMYQIIKKPFLTLESINVIKNNLKAVEGIDNFSYSVSGLTFYIDHNKSFIISCSLNGEIKMYCYSY